jgi:transposase
MKKIFKYEITQANNNYNINYCFDDKNYEIVKDKYLEKTVLITNRDNWTNEEILSAYRMQFNVEKAFKQMKNTKYLSFRLVRHFVDKAIIVHSFYSVLGYTLSSLVQREMEKLVYKKTLSEMFNELNQAMLTINVSNISSPK